MASRIMIAIFLLLAAAPDARAGSDLVVDLSESVVAVTTGFAGSSLLLFGATGGEGDVIVVVRGPQRDVIVRRKDRAAGVWVNQEELVFEQIPHFYAIASNRPVDEFLPPKLQALHQIGVEYLELTPKSDNAAASNYEAFRAALIRNLQKQELYGHKQGDVIFLDDRLFRTRLRFPANVAVGSYVVEVYLVRDGEVASIETTILTVRKFGFSANVYNFAHRHSLAYGLIAVMIAAAAGWLAGVVFRKA